MTWIKEKYDQDAAAHEAGGGSCVTIQIGGRDVKACVDANGKIIDEALKRIADANGSLPTTNFVPDFTW
jgi:hypothetical protein